MHLRGYRDASNDACGVEGDVLGLPTGAIGTPVSTGDKFAFDMRQTVPSFGGMILVFSNGQGADIADLNTGTQLWENGTADQAWHHYTGDLSGFAGYSVTRLVAGIHATMPNGPFDMYFANVVILHADGSVTPFYTGQSGVAVANFSGNQCRAQQTGSASEITPVTDPTITTTYYLDDHLGTTQMEFSSGGWPTWTGQFTPSESCSGAGLCDMGAAGSKGCWHPNWADATVSKRPDETA